MRCQGILTLDGTALPWVTLEVAQAATGATVSVVPRDVVDLTATERATVTMGLVTDDGYSPWAIVTDAPVREISSTISGSGDATQFSIDGADNRFKIAPPSEHTYKATEILELAATVYGLAGFGLVWSNVPSFVVEEAKLTPGSSYHATMSSFLGAFEPLYFLDASSGALAILDARRPLPGGLPARELGPGDFVRRSVSRSQGDPVNAVDVVYYVDALPKPLGFFVEREVEVDGAETPDGYAKAKSWDVVHEWHEELDHPERVTRTQVVGRKVRQFSATERGAIDSESETRTEYYAGTGETVELRKTVKKWSRVRLPAGGTELVQISEEQQSRVCVPGTTGKLKIVEEYTKEEGFVLLPDRVPLGEASRSGIVELEARQSILWEKIKHSHTTYRVVGPGQLERLTTTWDDLHGGIETQNAPTDAGDADVTTERPTATFLMVDAASLGAGDGLRPRVRFDARPYGLEGGKEIVREHIFARNRVPTVTDQIELVDFDASCHVGELWKVRDRAGAEYYYVATAVRQRLSVANPKSPEATTSLTALRLQVS